MGKPFKSPENAGAKSVLQTAMCEVVSAVSALNMHPSPKEAPPDSMGYLSETDEWAAHAVEHLRSVLDELRKLDLKLGMAQDLAYRHAQGRTTPAELFDQMMDLVSGKDDGDADGATEEPTESDTP